MSVVLERRAAPRAIAGRGREAAPAVGAEGRVGFGAGTVAGGRGMRDAGGGMGRGTRCHAYPISHPASRLFGPVRSTGFRGVYGFQNIVVRGRGLSPAALELELRLHS